MVRLFVKIDEEILELIKKFVQKNNGNLLKFSKEVGVCRTTIYHWLERKIWVDANKLKKICKYLNLDYDKFIKGKEENKHTLEISSPMFWHVLINHFKISGGKKNFIVSVPKQIFNSSKNCKLAFLTASIEGDGSWPPNTINIRMTSQSYIVGCHILLSQLGY